MKIFLKISVFITLTFGVLVAIRHYYDYQKKQAIIHAIQDELLAENGNKIDFSKIDIILFDRVCFFGAYAINEIFFSAAGFKWDMEKNTPITDNDGISIIVFLNKNKVVNFVEYSFGDFSHVPPACVSKEHAILYNINIPPKDPIWNISQKP